jgi:hypothetical protein
MNRGHLSSFETGKMAMHVELETSSLAERNQTGATKDRPQAILAGAFSDAAQDLVSNGERHIEPADLVKRVLVKAMEALQRMRDSEATWLYGQRHLWPDIVHTYAERLEAYRQEIASGDRPIARGSVAPVEVMRMHVIFERFPYLIVGKTRRRDYRIICLAAGSMKMTKISTIVGCSRDTIYDRQKLQHAAIALALDDLMPKPETVAAMIEVFDRQTGWA